MKVIPTLSRSLLIIILIAVSISCEQEPQFTPKERSVLPEYETGLTFTTALGTSNFTFSPKRGLPGTSTVTLVTSVSGIIRPAYTVTFAACPEGGRFCEGAEAVILQVQYYKYGTYITVRVPAGAVAGKITLTVDGAAYTSADDFVPYAIPTSGLVAFYPFDGNANDISGNNLHGTVSGAVLSPNRSGTANSAYLFDGQDDFISAGNPTQLQITNQMTLAAWIRLTATTGALRDIVTKLGSTGTTTTGYNFVKDWSVSNGGFHRISFHAYPNGPGCLNYLTGQINASEWKFVAITLDGSTLRSYHNGLLVSEVTNQCPLTNTTLGNFLIGKGTTGYSPFQGNIDDVTVYNRALTASEMLQLYYQ
jgi:hypothetical protein